jgi:putative lipoprotein
VFLVNKIIVLLGAMLLLAGCQQSTTPDSRSAFKGEVNLRGNQPVELPAGAMLTISLQDVSLMDVPSVTLNDRTYSITGQPPYPFELPYDAETLDDQRSYNLRATIIADKQLIYTSTEHINPLNESPLSIYLSAVGRQSMGQKPNATVTNTYWRAIDLFDVPIDPDSNGKEIHLKLLGDRATGFAGCNNFSGGYTLSGDQISFGPLASTRMMCSDAMQAELQLHRAMDSTTRFVVYGDILTLFADQMAVARFEAVYLQ